MKTQLRDDRGFTLIELMVVILIIGVLAAIALPNFLNQRDRAQDAAAKANARNMVSHVESCFVKNDDYTQCVTLTQLGDGIGIGIGTAANEVQVQSSTADAYALTAYSKTGSTFRIVKAGTTGAMTHSCTIAPGKSDAGCKNGTW